MKTLSNIISYLFHPVYMPTVGMAIVLYAGLYQRYPLPVKLYILLVIFVFTCLFPLFSIFLLRYMKQISSAHMPMRQERRLPLLLAFVFFFTAYFLIRSQELGRILDIIMLAGVFTMVVLLIINFIYKLSVHMAALGSLTGLLTILCLLPNNGMALYLFAVIAASGLVGFARLGLKAHSIGEVACGYVTGFVAQYVVLRLLIVA